MTDKPKVTFHESKTYTAADNPAEYTRIMKDIVRRQSVEVSLLRKRLDAAMAVVNEQAEDVGLFFDAVYITEAYLMQELRRLHAAVEGDGD